VQILCDVASHSQSSVAENKGCDYADDRRIEMRKSEFLAKAWKLANDKARELGWIV
jgi:hypothetical protein